MNSLHEDWDKYRYAGWVPTTTGHLSFSAIGVDRLGFYYGYHYWNRRQAEHPRYADNVPDVFVYQWRPNPEFGLLRRALNGLFARGTLKISRPGPHGNFHVAKTLRDRVFPPHTSQYFILQGKTHVASTPYNSESSQSHPGRTDDQGCLCGEVIVAIRNFEEPADRWEGFKADLEALPFRNITTEGQADFDKRWQDLQDRINPKTGKGPILFQKISFILYRTGEVRVGLDSDGVELLEVDAKSKVPAIFKQAFYFIKDCAHRHHHHRSDADQILRLVGAGPNDDLNWRRQTLWDLAKASGKLRREQSSIFKRREAAGISAYAEAFQSNLGRHIRDKEQFRAVNEIATFDYSHQQKSIMSSNEVASFRRLGISSLAVGYVALLMSFVSVYHTASSINNANRLVVCILDTEFKWLPLAVVLFAFACLYDFAYYGRGPAVRAWKWCVHGLLALSRTQNRALGTIFVGMAIAIVGWIAARGAVQFDSGILWPWNC